MELNLLDLEQHELAVAVLLAEMLAEEDAEQTGSHTGDDDKDDFRVGAHLHDPLGGLSIRLGHAHDPSPGLSARLLSPGTDFRFR